MDEDTLLQFDDIDKCLRDIIYSIKRPEHMLLDLDSTLFGTYGSQEGEGFRRLVLPANMRKQQVDTIRLKLIKIAARAVRSARYITFKLCSSCPYKKEFYRPLENIQRRLYNWNSNY